MVHLSFTLSMPGRGSWNGGWSGEDRLYARVMKFRKEPQVNGKPILGSHHYFWSDGWSARVEVKQVEIAEAKRIKKQSRGFHGYDWMIDSLLQHGEILDSKQRRAAAGEEGGA